MPVHHLLALMVLRPCSGQSPDRRAFGDNNADQPRCSRIAIFAIKNNSICHKKLPATVIGRIYQNMSYKRQIGCRKLAAVGVALRCGGKMGRGLAFLIW
jgi:hypothetical protein